MASASVLSYFSDLLSQKAEGATIPPSSYESKVFSSQNAPILRASLSPEIDQKKQNAPDLAMIDGAALLPESGPSGSAGDLPDSDFAAPISVYVVREGDTLGSIAQMFHVSVNTILWANNLSSHVISKDQQLVILPISGIRYTVLKGDTVASIVKKYKADAEEVRQYNDLAAGENPAVGTVIMLPDAEMAIPPAAAPSKGNPKPSSFQSNPYRGGSGPRLDGYFARPIQSAHRTQGLHGYNGVDLGAPKGTPIWAAAAGQVIIARSGGYNGGYGSYVVISHDNGTQTLYAHMSEVLVSSGDRVSQGQVIGLVGTTGHSTGPHLHFEIRGAVNFCADASNPCSTY